MAKSSRAGKNRPNFPRDLMAALGPTPLLKFENRQVYEELVAQFAAAVTPTDGIEWLWLKDVADLSWEIIRLRRIKVALIDSVISQRMYSLLPLPEILEPRTVRTEEVVPEIRFNERTYRVTEEQARKAKESREKCIEERRRSPYFADQARDYEGVYANAFVEKIGELNLLEKLLESAERRRDAILNQITRRRAEFGANLRSSSSNVIDGEFEDLSTANTDLEPKS